MASTAAIFLLNLVLFAAAFFGGLRLSDRLGRFELLVCVCFSIAGAISGLWSRTWWLVVVPACVGFLWALGAFKWAIHLTDTRGEFAPPMLYYVFSPSASELLWAVVSTGAAVTGWALARRLGAPNRVHFGIMPPDLLISFSCPSGNSPFSGGNFMLKSRLKTTEPGSGLDAWRYGEAPPRERELWRIIQDVYSRYPLPPGPWCQSSLWVRGAGCSSLSDCCL